MNITERRHGKIGVLSLRGSFAGRPDVSVFEQAVFGLLKDKIHFVILDLSHLTFIDSAGLGAMISAMVSVGRQEGALTLAGVQGELQRIVSHMHLDRVFEVFETVEHAEASIAKKVKT